jgi:hypothetical protein
LSFRKKNENNCFSQRPQRTQRIEKKGIMEQRKLGEWNIGIMGQRGNK